METILNILKEIKADIGGLKVDVELDTSNSIADDSIQIVEETKNTVAIETTIHSTSTITGATKRYIEILPPTIFNRVSRIDNRCNEIQISAHIIKSKPFLQEVSYLFPSIIDKFTGDENISTDPLIVIHTMQHAVDELVKVGEDIEVEKDRLLINFNEFAEEFYQQISVNNQYWSDYIDPCSGLPVKSDGQKVFSEVQCAELLLGYQVMNAGCCKIILHPQWNSAVYPATIFTNAPSELVLQIIYSCMHVTAVVRK